jgi:trehalose synthase
MLTSVPVTPKALADYRPIVGDAPIDEIQRLAEPLRGARVLHLNATAFGGGVAEILSALVPLLNDLGLKADWQIIGGADEFFAVTKAIHNGLQGMFVPWTPSMRDTWLHYNRLNADLLDGEYDFVVVHDPQPAGVLALALERGRPKVGKWVWRCHIDLTAAQPELWDFLRPFLTPYDASIFTLNTYAKDDVTTPEVFFFPPAIDPLSPKNVPLAPDTVDAILSRYAIDPQRPVLAQVSRFDPWKDPLGVIDAYRLVKREIPQVQLVLVASMAHDDPEGWSYYERTARRAGEDMDIQILTNLTGVGNVEVNAIQTAARVVVQKSLREGFGLVVSEALWKGRPVVAGNVGGIPLQVLDGRTGYLATSPAACAERILFLLRNPQMADGMGAAGREHVRANFLITRYLCDHLKMYTALAGGQANAAPNQTLETSRPGPRGDTGESR